MNRRPWIRKTLSAAGTLLICAGLVLPTSAADNTASSAALRPAERFEALRLLATLSDAAKPPSYEGTATSLTDDDGYLLQISVTVYSKSADGCTRGVAVANAVGPKKKLLRGDDRISVGCKD